ncbi:hypothetical protein WEN_02990 [Mycoplasma wenyonii str. Massachusetts]|uniref:Uncharacterized protein n=1 Tax=Mycoplasma wenyonii (strain Massachusetts) TaxID=1197325 RepID=I6YBK2_MYCWM|nr:hypothetical protein [Mycoplasma wenyonii]AFN65381.1 hypothetical protein WEN_02990 [Mycoplasma wenyonii str. Massachusetts]
MSILIGKLASLTLVPVVGAGVAYTTMSTKLGGGEGQIRLTSIGDFEENCWVSVQGKLSEGGEETAKLLACPVKKGSEVARFYFYAKATNSVNLPKEVTNVTYTGNSRGGHYQFFVTFTDSWSKTISASNSTWDKTFPTGKSIKGNCTITSGRLGCNEEFAQRLESFNSNS